MTPSHIYYSPDSPVHGVHQSIYPSHGNIIPLFQQGSPYNIEKNIRINNIKSPKMLTLRFFFPSVYMKSSEIGPVPQTCPIPQTCLIIL
jgi:hypothetical protein